MKKNLKLLIPTLLIVLTAQFLLVRLFVKQSNQEMEKVQPQVDASIPHPSSDYDAKQVLQVILYAFKYNDLPFKDAGAKTFWQFSTARLRTQLRDKALVRPYFGEDLWKAMLDFDSYRITYSKIEDTQAVFEVELVSTKRLARAFVVAIHKNQDIWEIDQLLKKL